MSSSTSTSARAVSPLFALVRRLGHFQLPASICADIAPTLAAARQRHLQNYRRAREGRGASGGVSPASALLSEDQLQQQQAALQEQLALLQRTVQVLGKRALDEVTQQPAALPNRVEVFNKFADLIPLMRPTDGPLSLSRAASEEVEQQQQQKREDEEDHDVDGDDDDEAAPAAAAAAATAVRVGATKAEIKHYCACFVARALEWDQPGPAAHLARVLWPVSSTRMRHDAAQTNLLTTEQLSKLVLHSCGKLRTLPIPLRRDLLGSELLPVVVSSSVTKRVHMYMREYPLAAAEQELGLVARFSTLNPVMDRNRNIASGGAGASSSSSTSTSSSGRPTGTTAAAATAETPRHAEWWNDPSVQRHYVLALLMFVQDAKVMDDALRFTRAYAERRGIAVAMPLPKVQRRMLHLNSSIEAAAAAASAEATAASPASSSPPASSEQSSSLDGSGAGAATHGVLIPPTRAGLPDASFFRRVALILAIRIARIRSSLSPATDAALSHGRNNIARVLQQRKQQAQQQQDGAARPVKRSERGDYLDYPAGSPALPGMFLLFFDLFFAMSEREQFTLLTDIRPAMVDRIISNCVRLFSKAGAPSTSSATPLSSASASGAALGSNTGGASSLATGFGVLVRKHRRHVLGEHVAGQQQQQTWTIRTMVVDKRKDEFLRHLVRVHCGSLPRLAGIACRHWTFLSPVAARRAALMARADAAASQHGSASISSSSSASGNVFDPAADDFDILFQSLVTAAQRAKVHAEHLERHRSRAAADDAGTPGSTAAVDRRGSAAAVVSATIARSTQHIFGRWYVLRVLATGRNYGWLRRAHFAALPELLEQMAHGMRVLSEGDLCRWARAYLMLRFESRPLCEALAEAMVQMGTTPKFMGLYMRVLAPMATRALRAPYQLMLRRIEQAYTVSPGPALAASIAAANSTAAMPPTIRASPRARSARNDDNNEEDEDEDHDADDDAEEGGASLSLSPASIKQLDDGLYTPPAPATLQQQQPTLPLLSIVEMLFASQQGAPGHMMLSNEVILILSPMLGHYATWALMSSSSAGSSPQLGGKIWSPNPLPITMTLTDLALFSRLIVPVIAAGVVRPSSSVRIRCIFIKLVDILVGVLHRPPPASSAAAGAAASGSETALLIPPVKRIGVTDIVTPAAHVASMRAVCVVLTDLATRLSLLRDPRVRRFRRRIEGAAASFLLNASLLHANHMMLLRVVTHTMVLISRQIDGSIEGAEAEAVAQRERQHREERSKGGDGGATAAAPSAPRVSGPIVTSRRRHFSKRRGVAGGRLAIATAGGGGNGARASAAPSLRPPPAAIRTVLHILTQAVAHVHRCDNLRRVPWDTQLRAAALLVKHCRDGDSPKKFGGNIGSADGTAAAAAAAPTSRREQFPRLHRALDAVCMILETNQQLLMRSTHYGATTTELQIFFWSRAPLLENHLDPTLMQKLCSLIPKPAAAAAEVVPTPSASTDDDDAKRVTN